MGAMWHTPHLHITGNRLNKLNTMKTKTFNIGEYAVGGRIRIDIYGKIVLIQAIDWSTGDVVSSGSLHLPDSNAAFNFDRGKAKQQVRTYLHTLTSSYHVDEIMEYMAAKMLRRTTPEERQFADNWAKLF